MRKINREKPASIAIMEEKHKYDKLITDIIPVPSRRDLKTYESGEETWANLRSIRARAITECNSALDDLVGILNDLKANELVPKDEWIPSIGAIVRTCKELARIIDDSVAAKFHDPQAGLIAEDNELVIRYEPRKEG